MIDTTVFQDKTAVYYTLDCKLNFSETLTIDKILREASVCMAREGEKADLCIVNTCSVAEVADRKCRQAIYRLTKQHPGVSVVVTGYYTQLEPGNVAEIEGVNVVLGAEQKKDLLQYLSGLHKHEGEEAYTTATKDIRSFAPPCSGGDHAYFFLKIQDGCDYFCFYCTISFARGRSRNGIVASLVERTRQVTAEGGEEIALAGVSIEGSGKSTGETFSDLVRVLDQVEDIERYHILSTKPSLLTNEIIEYAFTSRSFMPHSHTPLQSGCDRVLQLICRRYETKLFALKIAKIKEVMLDASIGMDIIVGTCDETDRHFEKVYEFISGLDIMQLHVFSYSERLGTQAPKVDHVMILEAKHQRDQRLFVLSGGKTKDFYVCYIGQTMSVLVEKPKVRAPIRGSTANYIRVEVKGNQALNDQVVNTLLGNFNEDGTVLKGTITQ